MKQFILLLGANQYLRERALAGARKASGAEILSPIKRVCLIKIDILMVVYFVMRKILLLL
ncbi:hypothetical protein MQ967_001441 [Campylobacter upsaliensis]|nr:hypothetical protein [Campylobacter upsaliensis]